MMHRALATTLVLSLGLSLGLSSGCRRATSPDGKSPKQKDAVAEQAEIVLPDPLPIDNPLAVSWIAKPGRAIAMLEPYSPNPINVRGLAQMGLQRITEASVAEAIAAAIHLERPFANAILEDEEIYRFALLDEQRAALAERFAGLESVGDFGAVRLPPDPNAGSEARAWLAWIDEQEGGVLTIANTERGLATARSIAASYGEQPVFFSLELSRLPVPAEVPVARVEGVGTLDELRVEVQMKPGQDPLANFPIAAGALTGLLDGEDIVAGLSTRYSEYDVQVRELSAQINAQVRELPFLVRPIGEELAASFNTLARTWDGRTLVALGPSNHLRVAYGAKDVEKSRVAMIHLLQKVLENASLARNFTDAVPKMNLRRRVAKGDGQDIELLVLHRAANFVPPEGRALLDEEGKLNLAMAWSERAGGGTFMIGPDAANELARWLDSTASAPAHTETSEQLGALVFAGDPAQLSPLLTADPETIDPAKILALSGSGPRWRINITPSAPERYVIELRTPGEPMPARAD